MAAKDSEVDEDRAVQSYAALGVGLVVIVIGLPLWWKTTEVYRVQLPYGEIDELSTARMSYSVQFDVVSLCDDSADHATFLSELPRKLHSRLNHDLEDTELSVQYIAKARSADERERSTWERAYSLEDADKQLDGLVARSSGSYTLYLVPAVGGFLHTWLSAKVVVAQRRAAYVQNSDDQEAVMALMAQVMREVVADQDAVVKAFQTSRAAVHMQADKESMRSLKLSFGCDITFTLFNPQPAMLRVNWDIEGAIHRYLQVLLEKFKEYSDIKVASQFLHYVGLGVVPKRDEAGGCFVLRMDQLPHIINPIEAYLGSHVSNNPNINFIVYIPTREQTPLKIYDSSGKPSVANALFSPRWGGLLVYNVDAHLTPPVGNSTTVLYPMSVDVDMRPVMAVFASQLRLLLGVNSAAGSEDIAVLPPGSKLISDWELDRWLRERAVENVATCAATLQSLSALLGRIENLVINDDIGKQVENAVRFLRESRQLLVQARLREAFLTSREALKASEKAFFDPSLLELLYFPEDQKFAIYVPLFLPIGIPIVLSVIQALRWLTQKKPKSKID